MPARTADGERSLPARHVRGALPRTDFALVQHIAIAKVSRAEGLLDGGCMRLLGLCAVAWFALLPGPALLAQTAAPTGAHAERLEAAAREPDYKNLATLLFNPGSAEETGANLDWLGVRFFRGDSAFFAWAYSRTLVGVADHMPSAQAVELRSTALAALLNASAVSLVDGQQCADGSARTNRMEQFSGQLRSSGLMQLDETSRRKAAFVALMIEQKTWPARRTRNDTRFLCANGMAAMSAGIAAGRTSERAARPGEFGKQVSVSPPPDFVYERRADTEWWSEADKVRGELPALIARLAAIDHVATPDEMDKMLPRE